MQKDAELERQNVEAESLQRDKSMPLRAGTTYAFEIAYQPHIVRAGDAV